MLVHITTFAEEQEERAVVLEETTSPILLFN